MPAVFCESPPGDIKCYPQKTLFHLPPSWNQDQSTGFASKNDNAKLEPYKNGCRSLFHKAFPYQFSLRDPAIKEALPQARERLQKATRASLPEKFPTNRLLLNRQTAFSNFQYWRQCTEYPRSKGPTVGLPQSR